MLLYSYIMHTINAAIYVIGTVINLAWSFKKKSEAIGHKSFPALFFLDKDHTLNFLWTFYSDPETKA